MQQSKKKANKQDNHNINSNKCTFHFWKIMVKKTYHTPLHVTLELPQVNSTQHLIGLIPK